MIKNNLRYLLFFALVVMIVSCHSKGPKEAKYIPKDASFVLAVDPGSLQDKMKTGNIDIDSLFKQAMGHDSLKQKDKQAFENFKNAGIDWSEKFFMFATQKTDISKGQSNFINLLGSLKDSSKFLTYLQSIDEIKGRDVKKGNGYSYIQLDYHGMISWTDKNVIATFYIYTEHPRNFMDSTPPAAPYINKSEVIAKEVARYYSLQDKETIASAPPFADMFKEKADGYFLSTSSNALNALSKLPVQLPKLDELLKDNYTTGTFNFDKGEIVTTSHFYPNNMLAALLKKYGGRKVNTSMIEKYPSKNIDLATIISFNPDIFGGLLQQLEVEALADGFLEKVGITSKDLYKCLNGDIAFIISDFNLQQKNTPSPTKPNGNPYAKMLFNATIGDMNSFNKLMGKAVEMGYIVKTSNGYQSGTLMHMMGLYLHTDNKNLILASDSTTYTQYAASTEKAAISSEVMNEIKGKSSALYIDLDKVIGGFIMEPETSNEQSGLSIMKATFKDVIATADNFDGSKLSGKMEIRLKDDKQNSLVTLMKLIPSVTEQIKKSRASATADGSNESILSLPFLSRITNL